MSYYKHLSEAKGVERNGATSYLLLTENHGCRNGCRTGISVFFNSEYPEAQTHQDQEGFLVVEGEGWAKVGGEEFRIKPEISFIVPAGVTHAIKKDPDSIPVKVFWFHAAV